MTLLQRNKILYPEQKVAVSIETCVFAPQASYVLSLAQHFSDGLLSDDALYGAPSR